LRIWNFTEDENGLLIAPIDFPSAAADGRAIALGYFDGVHLGHQMILDRLKSIAVKQNLPAMVHTFSSIPKSKSSDLKDKTALQLTTLTEKCNCFARAGMDETALFPFSAQMSSMQAMDFMQNILKDQLHAKVIVAGEDYRFGQNREGDMHLLTVWGQKNNIEVYSVPPLLHNGQVISSTWIRECLRTGKTSLANTLLGYPVSYEGTVQHGRHLGRTLGFPTANVVPEKGKVIPAYGVYASILYTNKAFYPSITNIGLRPTVNTSEVAPVIETMMFDRKMDLYEEHIRVFLLTFIRPEYRFPDLQALKEQANKDMNEVRHYHDLHGHDYSILLTGVI
jgi:riboflavin kinase/FMN adenylyltransferase